MSYEEITALLGGWEGFRVVGVQRKTGSDGQAEVVIELAAQPDTARRCGRCGEVTQDVHETIVRRIRELPILDADTWLLIPLARVSCPACGPTTEALSWLDRYARMTKRFAESVARLARVLPIKQVADHYGLHWETVKAIDRAALEEQLGPVDLTGVRQIAIDEFAIRKGHRYATSVVDAQNSRVLWVGRGHRREDIRPFFLLLGAEGCAQIEAAVMDMSEAYELETRAHCPKAEVVFDLFHIVAKYGREVMDRVRVDQTNRLARAGRNDNRTRARRRVIKGTRWLLLRNRENVTAPRDRIRLREVLAANRALWVVYILKDALKQLWRYRYRRAAQRAWYQWYGWAIRSRIPALVIFAKRLKPKLSGILAHCRYPLNTSLLEGINNKIKVL
jgi:transposase